VRLTTRAKNQMKVHLKGKHLQSREHLHQITWRHPAALSVIQQQDQDQ